MKKSINKKREVINFIKSFIKSDQTGIEFTEENLKLLTELNVTYIDNNIYKDREYLGKELNTIIKLANLKYNLDIEWGYANTYDLYGNKEYVFSWAGIIDGELYFDLLKY